MKRHSRVGEIRRQDASRAIGRERALPPTSSRNRNCQQRQLFTESDVTMNGIFRFYFIDMVK